MTITTEQTYQRPISPTEWIYLANPGGTSNVLQIFVEGTGVVELVALTEAVAAASVACPGARLVRQGKFWVSFDNLPELNRPLRGDDGGPTTEVVLLMGVRPAVVFRAHHSVMDGVGLLTWMAEVFRALRDEPLHGAPSRETDTALVRRIGIPQGVSSKGPKVDSTFRAPGGFHRRGGFVRRRTLMGNHPALVAKLASTINEECRLAQGAFFIPVDLRRHDTDLSSTGNLALPIGIHLMPEATWQQAHAKILGALAKKTELTFFPHLSAIESLVKIPLGVFRPVGRLLDAISSRTPRSTWSFSLSDLGKLDLADYTTDTFEAATVYSVPGRGYFFAPSFSLAQVQGHTEIVFTADDGPGMAERGEELLDRIVEKISAIPV
jgi:hypothetical protein